MTHRRSDDLDAATWAAIAKAAGQVPRRAAAEPDVLPDWRRAMLDQAVEADGLRGRIARAPAATPGIPVPDLDAVPPPSAPPGWIPPLVDRASIPARPSPLAPGDRLRLRLGPLAPTAPAPGSAGWRPGAPPPTSEAYRRLSRWFYGPRLDALLALLDEEPLFAYAARRWTVQPANGPPLTAAAAAANLELLHVVYDRLSALMATLFDFQPAPLVQIHQARPGWVGVYMGHVDAIAASSALLGAVFDEVLNTIAHEQIHAMQWARMRAGGAGLDPYERSLVAYWSAEMPRIARVPYRQRGVEITAFDVGDAVGWKAMRLG